MSYCEVRYEHFKREDSTNSIIVTLFDDDQVTPIVPNSSHSWSAKVAKEEDEEKYVGEYPVQIRGNEIILTSDRLVRLPRGTYLMELWENNSGKVTIYPSADFIQFTIHKNATDTMGHVDPTTDINKIIDDLHKAGQNIKLGTVTTGAPGSSVIIRQRLENGQNLLDFTIPRGDKGEQGNVGPAPTIRVGSVTKVAPGGTPTASVTGSNGSYALNLGIPEGQQGTGFNRTAIASGTDLNSVRQNGYYSLMGATNVKNVPPVANASFFNLVVFSDGDTLTQLVMDPNASAMYMRGCTNGLTLWHPWAKIGGVPNLLIGTSSRKNVGPDHWEDIPAKPNTYYTFSGVIASAGNDGGDSKILASYIRFMDGNGNRITQHGDNISVPFTERSFATTALSPAGTVTMQVFFAYDGKIKPDYSYSQLSLVEFPSAQSWSPSPLDALAARLEKLGGVSDGSLSPNLVPSGNTPVFRIDGETEIDSTSHLSAQRFGYVYDKECLPKQSIYVHPNKGDVITQRVIIRISEGAELDSRISFTFFGSTQGHYQHYFVPTTITPLENNQYLVSATWTIPKDGFVLRLLDIAYFGLHSAPGNGDDAWIEIDSPYAGLVQSGG